MHCGKRMLLSYSVGERMNYVCANQCGHRAWDGMEAETAPPPRAMFRPCEYCRLALPWRVKKQTKYHGHCASAVKRRQQNEYQRRVAKAAAR